VESSDGYMSAELKRGDQNLAPSLMEEIKVPNTHHTHPANLFAIKSYRSLSTSFLNLRQLRSMTPLGLLLVFQKIENIFKKNWNKTGTFIFGFLGYADSSCCPTDSEIPLLATHWH